MSERADAYHRLSEEYIHEVMQLRRSIELAGHRTPDEHNCFDMNCKGLGYEVERLRESLRDLSGQLDGMAGAYKELQERFITFADNLDAERMKRSGHREPWCRGDHGPAVPCDRRVKDDPHVPQWEERRGR